MQPPSVILSLISVITRAAFCAHCEGSSLWNVELRHNHHAASAEALLRITATDWHPLSPTRFCVRQWKYAYHP